MVVVIIVALVVEKGGSCCFCCVGPVAAFFIPQLPPIVSDDPLGMRGLHTAVCSAAPTGWLSSQVFFSVTYVTCCIECSVAPTVAAPQTEAPSSVHKCFDAFPIRVNEFNIDRATVASLEADRGVRISVLHEARCD